MRSGVVIVAKNVFVEEDIVLGRKVTEFVHVRFSHGPYIKPGLRLFRLSPHRHSVVSSVPGGMRVGSVSGGMKQLCDTAAFITSVCVPHPYTTL